MSPAARALRPFVLRQWRALAEAGGATVALTVADLAKPWPLALVVDRMLDGRTPPFELVPADVRLLVLVAVLVLLIALLEAAAQYVADLRLQVAGERIAHELRTSVYDHLQRLSLGFHQRRQKGDLLTHVTSDVNAMGDLFATSIGQITQAALLSAGMLTVLLWLDPVLALIAMSTAPLLAGVSWVYRRRVRLQARERRTHEGRIASVAGEALSAMAIVKSLGSGSHEADRVRRGSEERMAAGVEVARLQARFDGLVGSVRAIGTALVLVIGVLRVANGALTPGELIVFVSYTRKAHNPLRRLARETTKAAAAMARMERLAEVLAADDVLEDRPGAFHGGRAAGELALERVAFAYGDDRPALHDVTLRVPAGRCVAVIGPSGAGKSTLGALVARLYDPTAGRVLLDGRDLRDCSLGWLREQVAIVLQETVLFTGSVRENIAYGTDADPGAVEAAARAAAAHDFVVALPDGYDTPLGPQGAGLSGGQRQRIGIARTLLRDPPVLLLDEPTTGLDEASEGELLAGLRALIAGRTTLLITHSARLAALADHVVELRDGRVGPAPPRRPAVTDAALPSLSALLDPAAMAPVLARTLRPGTGLGEPTVARVVYKPGELVAVHYRTAPGDAVLTSMAGTDLAARARAPRYAAAARRVNGRSPAPAPLTYDAEADALVTWLPYDPRLPALAEPPEALVRRLRAVGADLPAGEPALIGYKPRGRAVLAAGDLLLKAYGSERWFAAALDGLRRSAAAPLRAPAFVAALPELRLTVQRRVAGVPPADAVAAAGEAGALAAALHAGALGALPAAPPAQLLAGARRKAAVVAAVLPALAPRLDALLARLGGAAPDALPLVPSHGDFHADQLLLGPAGMTLVDFDELCRAAPALDLATYAADVVRGRADDRDGARRRPRRAARRLRHAARGARLARRRGRARPHRASVPAPGPGLAGADGADARRRGGRGVTRALVTGCAGFIGSHLTESLLADGHDVLGVDCFNDNYAAAEKRANLAGPLAHPRFRLAVADLGRADAAALLAGTDVVFHLAAEPGVRPSWGRRFDRYVHNNVVATQRLLEVSAERPERRFVYASSSSVYGDAAGLPTLEDALPRPLSPYGVTKLAAEQLCALYHAERGVQAVALRFFSVYGPRQRPDMAFRRFCRAALDGAPIRLFGDGRQTRDFTYVADVVAGLRAAAAAPGAPGRVYNIGGGDRVSLNRALELLAAAAGRPLDVRRQARETGDVLHTGADIARARAELGFDPATGLEAGLRAELDWLARAEPAGRRAAGLARSAR